MTDALLSDADVGLAPPAPSSTGPQGLLSDEDVGIAPHPSTGADVAKSTASGLAQGVYAIPGQLGDLERGGKWLMDTATEIPDYGMLWAQGKVAEMAGGLPQGQTASDWATQKLSQLNATREGVDAMPSTAEIASGAHALGVPDYQPKTAPGQYASTIASFVPQTLLAPEKSAADIAGNVAKYALAPGVASETAGQVTSGTALEPWARGIAAAGTGVGVAGAEATAKAAKKFMQPFTEEGQQALAAEKLAGSFTDPQAAAAELAKAAALQAPGGGMGEIVPGSRPTTGQLTGDLGALSTERQIATAQPTLFKNNPFGTGSEQQNAARSAALGAIQSEGDPAAVSATLRDQLSKIEATHDRAVKDATTAAQTSGAKIGTGAAPEDVGENLRGTLQAARDAAKAKERALWTAVDPDGTLALPAAPIATGADKITGEVPSTAKPMSGEEAAIFDTASNLPAVAPFSDITALRSRISSAMRQELMSAGQSETYRRLSMLRGNVEDAITNAVENRAALEQHAVNTGAMSIEATMGARLQADANAFSQAKTQARTNPGGNIGENAGVGSSAVPGADRTEIPSAGGLGNPPGNPGLPSANVDEAAATRLSAASAATKARAATFDAGPVGQVLRKAGNASDYRIANASVPGKLWEAGPKGAETVGAYAGAAGPSGMSPVHDAAAESLRREAMTPEGIIDPGKFARWQSKYQDALRAMPASLKAKFSTAAGAGQSVEDAAAARKAAIDGYQKSAAGKFLGLSNPQDVTKTVSSILGAKDGVRQMTDLAKRVAGDPVAVEGLRKAVADVILAKAMSTTEHGASGIENINAATFQKFLRDNSETIKAAGFSDRELGSMQAIAQDLQRGQRTLQATRLPGQSNSPQDLIKAIERAGQSHHVSLLTKLAGGAYLGWEHGQLKGAVIGAIAGGGEHLIASLRDAGIGKSAILVRDALLNPELALALLKKAPIKAGHGSERTLAGVLARTAMLTPQRVSAFNARTAP